MADSCVEEIAVFARTNLGTRIVIAVSPESTVGDFKREFERAHFNCFPEFGKIRVCALKVKKKSCFYSLPESFPLKHVFDSLKNHLLHVEVYHLQNQSGPAESQEAEICNHISDFKDAPNTSKVQNFIATTTKNQKRYRRKKRRAKRILCFWEFPRVVHFFKFKKKCNNRRRNIAVKNPVHGFQQRPQFSEDKVNHFVSGTDINRGKQLDRNPQVECPSEILSETISVSGIIERYFSNYDEVTSSLRSSFSALPILSKEYSMREMGSKHQNREFDMSLPLMDHTPPQRLHPPRLLDQHRPKSSRGTNEKNVGRRLVAASDNLGVNVSKKTPPLSLFKFRDRNPLVPNASTPIKHLVFDITGEDD